MSKKSFLKIFISIAFVLAAAFGLWQHGLDPYAGQGPREKGLTELPESNGSLENYYQRSQELTPQNSPATASFLAVGDIMLSRSVAGAIRKSADNELPFRDMADILKSVNFSFGNLESPLSPGSGIVGGHSLAFAAPADYAQGLVDFNFKILNLANNHALDQGISGLDYTMQYLDRNGIRHVGTGDNLKEAWQPAAVDANGIKICFAGASYASVNDNGKTANNYVARIENLSSLKSEISSLKSSCDFVVATMHAGTEYTRQPSEAQINFARAAIDDGADLVIGGHPHWVQTVEKYRGKYIFYSLGNFIFDQEWSRDTKEGLALKITLSKSGAPAAGPQNQNGNQAAPGTTLQGPRIAAKLDAIELIPVIIENYSTPRPATADETKSILKKIGQTNAIIKP
ncbi:MAG: CapA family protein [Patescibacteria group bacterium]|nr:CapA family protein [Patescibacteria group bacterium]